MRRNQKDFTRITMLLFMTVLAVGIVKWSYTANEPSIPTHNGEFELSLWLTDNLCINWWKNEADNTYCFFIPNAFKNQKMRLTFSEIPYLTIDGKKITSGSKYCLAQGTHSLITEENNNTAYTLTVWYTSGIPTFFVQTQSGSVESIHSSKQLSESGKILIMDSRGRSYFEGIIDEIHCRGNSSFDKTEKKSYTISLNKSMDLFEMGKAKKWLLIANAFDDTLVRNASAFFIAELLKLPYTPKFQYVDVYINGNFVGNYLLSEKVEIGKNRVNIRNLEKEVVSLNKNCNLADTDFFMEQQGRLFSTKGYHIEKEPEDISGGYLLELETSDRYGLEASGFLTSRMQPVVFASPKYASYNQVSYIAGLYQDFEDAVFSADGSNPYTGKMYYEYIDVDSFARKYLLEELVKNLDASFTSQYIYKYDDSISSKFYAGPCWDYDKSIAASGITEDGINLNDPKGLYAAVQEKESDIWYALYQHKDFRKTVAAIFFKELEPHLKNNCEKIFFEYSKNIRSSNDCNMIRWNTFPQAATIDEKRILYNTKVLELADFIDKRLDFLKSEWEALQDD
ncbi:MAG: CotH kinase family protein [Lachnospiraceae bacterium]|nr:CotH kinase family protein [Lachnospiraceae bacterium]